MTETTTSNFLIDVIADVPDGEIRRTVDIYNVNGTIYSGQTFATRGKRVAVKTRHVARNSSIARGISGLWTSANPGAGLAPFPW